MTATVGSDPIESWRGPGSAKPGVPELRLELLSDRSCRAQLVVEKKVAYGIAAEVPPLAKFTDAGEDVARVIGQFHVDVRRSQIPKPSRWNVVPLAGLPFLRDEQPYNDRTGWILSAIDLSFLRCSLGAGAMSFSARNDSAENPTRDLHVADAYLTTSALCLAGWVGTKIVGAALYQP
jgi:hypothetical protein